MPRIVHFEQAYDDPEGAVKFYASVFDWKVESWEGGEQPYWLVTTGPDTELPGINGGFMKKAPDMQNVTNTISVDNIDSYVEKIKQAGGKLVMPKSVIPKMGYQAYCIDPGGIGFGLFQMDETAS